MREEKLTRWLLNDDQKSNFYITKILEKRISLNSSSSLNLFNDQLDLECHELDKEILKQMSMRLEGCGIRAGTYVAVWLPRGHLALIYILLAIIFINKAVYIPFHMYEDGRQAAIRNQATLKDIQAMDSIRFVIMPRSAFGHNRYEFISSNVHDLGLGISLIIFCGRLKDREAAHADKFLSCIFHTSGTTREKPIPVRVPYNVVMSNVEAISQRLKEHRINDVYKTVAVTSPSFDPSITEILVPLFQLCTDQVESVSVVLPPDCVIISPLLLFKTIQELKLNILMMTPSLLLRFNDSHIATLLSKKTDVEDIILGGESFPRKLLAKPCEVRLWNIYGTTEFSVWASLDLVNEVDRSRMKCNIGRALDDITFVLRPTIESETYELWLEGHLRACIVGQETNALSMRFTGDLVVARGDRIEFLGRSSNIVKRSGYKINLTSISESFENSTEIQNFMIFDEKRQKIQCYVQISDLALLCKFPNLRDIFLRQNASYSLPDEFVVLKTLFPCTKNGKIDGKRLAAICKNADYQLKFPLMNISFSDYAANRLVYERLPAETLYNYVLRIFCNVLTCYVNHTPEELVTASHLISLGVDSLLTVNISHHLRESLDKSLTVAKCSFSKVKRRLPALILGHSLPDVVQIVTDSLEEADDGDESPHSPPWILATIDLEKCIDSTPILVKKQGIIYCYVGSHSGLFVCLKIEGETMMLEWETRLPDRIECRALYIDGVDLVAVGCYDGNLYFLSATEGVIRHAFATDGMIKSPPVNGKENSIVFGSYDNFIYHVRVMGDKVSLLWKFSIGASVYAAPAIDTPRNLVWGASLKGDVCCLDMLTGSLQASTSLNHPIFATPFLHQETGDLVCFCVDGSICRISLNGGRIVWKIQINGPLFSSPLMTDYGLLFGTHNKTVHAIDLTGQLLKSVQVSSEVFGMLAETRGYAFIPLVRGELGIYDLQNDKLNSFRLPGEIFSSPVIVNDNGNIIYALMGCRDNKLYYIQWR